MANKKSKKSSLIDGTKEEIYMAEEKTVETKGYFVAKGEAITTVKGIIGEGKKVDISAFEGKDKDLAVLVELGKVIKK